VWLGKVTITASGLLSFGIVELFRFLVVLVMAALALVADPPNMAIMERSVETDGRPRRNEQGTSSMTVSADGWTGLLSGIGGLGVTGYALHVVDVHYRVPISAEESEEQLGLAAVLHAQVAGIAISTFFRKNLSVLIMGELDGSTFQGPELRHIVD
jgi:hypothetical protein